MNSLPALLILLASTRPAAAPPVAEDAQAQVTLLRSLGLKSDTPSLLEFFLRRTLSDEQRKHITRLVRQLGDDTFAQRVAAQAALVEIGRPALPFLRSALEDPDPEIVRRARWCLGSIDKVSETTVALAAARVLAARRPPEAARALLAYLPFLEEESAEEEIFHALRPLSHRQGRPVPEILAAVEGWSPRQRGAAAWVLGRSANRLDRDRVVSLLADPSPRVRYRAADALVVGRDGRGIPALISLLGTAPMDLASRAEYRLGLLAGEQAPLEILTTSEERPRCQVAWQAWWRQHGKSLDLATIDPEERVLGLRLVIVNGGYGGSGAVWEYGTDHKTRWQLKNVGGPFDAQVLPGGRLLVAEYNDRRVSERDRANTILWEFRPNNAPLEVQRLPGGNTLITTNKEIVEVDRNGRIVFQHLDPSSNIFSAQKLRGGNILYGLYTGWIIEIDSKGREVSKFEIEKPRGLANILVLSEGRYLLPLASTHRIVELDRNGKVTREVPLASPTSVALLPGGNLLVGSHILNSVREVDGKGNVLWEQKAQGQVFRVRAR